MWKVFGDFPVNEEERKKLFTPWLSEENQQWNVTNEEIRKSIDFTPKRQLEKNPTLATQTDASPKVFFLIWIKLQFKKHF